MKLRRIAPMLGLLLLAAMTGCTAAPTAPGTTAPKETEAPPTLAAGELELVHQAPLLADLDLSDWPLMESDIAYSDEWIAVTSPPDGTLSVFARASLEPAWEAPGTTSDWGPCGPPRFLSEDLLVIVTGIQDASACSRFVVYELQSGEVAGEFDFVTAEYQGVKSYEQITGTAELDGRIWFVTSWAGLGVLDPKTGAPDFVLEGEELGVLDGSDGRRAHVISLAADPESDLLVTNLVHGEMIGDALAQDHYGIHVDGEEAEVVWKFGDTIDQADALGVDGLATADPLLRVDDRRAGAITIAELADGRMMFGRMDPATARIDSPVVPETPSLIVEALANTNGGYAVVGDLLVTGAENAEGTMTELVGYDLSTGAERWRSTPPVPDSARVRDVSVGTDGQVYVLSISPFIGDAALNRIELEHGESTDSWELPQGLFGENDFTARVIDDAVVIAWNSNQLPAYPTSPLVMLRSPSSGGS